MVQAQDILIQATQEGIGDLQFSSTGDLVIGASDVQHELFIFKSHPGWYRENLLCGIAIDDYLKSVGKALELQRTIRIQLERDNYSIDTVSVVPNPATSKYQITTRIARIR